MVDADQLPVPDAELRTRIVDLFLPDPEIIPLIKEAWGEDSDIYHGIVDVLTGQPADLDTDISRFGEWIFAHCELFADLPPIRPYVPDEDDF